jgi:hypothetical protein
MRFGVAAKVFLLAVWIVCAYRAFTQSITHDEALTYQLYLTQPFRWMFTYYDANHHFLNTLLMYFSTSLFGFSEWSLRLPALAGAALYFAAVYKLCRHVFGERPTLLLAVALLTLNPLVLDFLVAARGYSLALGLWFWALATLIPHLEAPDSGKSRQLMEGAITLALSVTANLVFLVPAALLAGFAIVWLLRRAPARLPEPVLIPKGKKRKAAVKEPPVKSGPSVWRYFAIPIVCVALLFFILAPLDVATSGNFYVGVPTIRESLRNLASASLLHGGPLRGLTAINAFSQAVAYLLAPVTLIAALIAGVMRRNVLLIAAAGSALGSAAFLIILHLIFGLAYPVDRTGIYFLILVPLALLGLMQVGSRSSGLAAAVLASQLVVLFHSPFDTRKFLVWDYDADTREIAGRIAGVAKERKPGSVKVAASWQLEPSLNFYRETSHWDWLQPVDRAPIAAGSDFYALIRADRAFVGSLGLRTLYQGPVSGSVLAVPSR